MADGHSFDELPAASGADQALPWDRWARGQRTARRRSLALGLPSRNRFAVSRAAHRSSQCGFLTLHAKGDRGAGAPAV